MRSPTALPSEMRLRMAAAVPLALLLLAWLCATAAVAAAPVPCSVVVTDGVSVALQNGFVLAQVNLQQPQLDVLKADFTGRAQFDGDNLLGVGVDPLQLNRRGLVLELDVLDATPDAAATSSPLRPNASPTGVSTWASSAPVSGSTPPQVVVHANTPSFASVAVTTAVADTVTGTAYAAVTFQFDLHVLSRELFTTVTAATPDSAAPITNALSYRVTARFASASLTLQRTPAATLQMMNQITGQYYAPTTTDPHDNGTAPWQAFHRAYSVGNGDSVSGARGSVELSRVRVVSQQHAAGPLQVLALSADPLVAAQGGWYRSGVSLQFLGVPWPGAYAQWTNNDWRVVSPAPKPVSLAPGAGISVAFSLAANSYAFPAAETGAPVDTSDGSDGSGDFDMPSDDIAAVMTGVYASPVGALVSSDFPGQISPSIATPLHAYEGGFNFFDPDSYLHITAMLSVGDAQLQRECRAVMERNLAVMLPTGQMPHHFLWTTPTYVAISGATQTGPNAFWLATAFEYVHVTGDGAWLKALWAPPHNASAALTYLTDQLRSVDGALDMLYAEGSLMIDVFIRNNFTSDTNAFLVYVLHSAADFEERVLGDRDAATTHRLMASNITAAMNAYLWASDAAGADHYVTQLDGGAGGATRDFVDYDSNLMAVAYGVAPDARVPAILQRVDRGNCTHARATYVSEKYYGKADCFGGNTGDSAVTMGRIGWADALSRVRVGDTKTFTDVLLAPLQADLLRDTWLYERYTCDGTPTHNAYYIEYPECVSMMVAQLKYGVALRYRHVTIAPFTAPPQFRFRFGAVDIAYDAVRGVASVRRPHADANAQDVDFAYTVQWPASASWANAQFVVTGVYDGPVTPPPPPYQATAQADSSGRVDFRGPSGEHWTVTLKPAA